MNKVQLIEKEVWLSLSTVLKNTFAKNAVFILLFEPE